jgi:NADH-quinone oxidoreductase subunit L
MSFLLLIPLLPLLASVVLALGGRRLGETGHRIGTTAVTLSWLLSVAALIRVVQAGPQTVDLYRFLDAGAFVVDLGLYVDQLTVLLLLLVTGVSAIVHVYSSRYMIGDPRYSRFFAVIALFTSAMAFLVMSRNLLMTYMCWEAMGICSYLLISHWGHRRAAGRAAMKAFLVNAVADVGLATGVLLTFQTFGTLDIPTILARAPELQESTATVIVLLLFAGAVGKSAQLPAHVWLPFAMEAPTPVSALIHAATMVNAGPFLLARFSPLLVVAPTAMTVIAVVGASTAIFAALVALTQTDIKKILAYSTISQIGFMTMACGVGAFAAAIFHLLAHGCLKAYLFLSTGNSLAALSASGSHGTHEAPGEASATPVSGLVAAGTLLLACLPPVILLSGPYEALWTINGSAAAGVVFWILALATIGVTAAYVVKGVAVHFRDGFAFAGGMVRPRLISTPHALIVVAGGLVVTAVLYEGATWFASFIAPALAQARPAVAVRLPGAMPWWPLALVAALAGWGGAMLHVRRPAPAGARRHGVRDRLYVLLWNKLYVDEVYDAVVVAPTLGVARGLAAHVERGLVDRALDGMASSAVFSALWLWRVLEGRGLDRAVNTTAVASLATARWLWRVLEGRGVQGTVDRLSHQADTVGRFFQDREMHTLQEHLLLVVGGLATLLGVFYLAIQWGAS